ncbi:unnamed protein product [Schistosoma mattheei]|uniref:Uncharacterized protein n=1 Tax=Schistosoma mattheei TaxID=31246 RepID=A0A183PXY7_9TREM|nr:unnamed protein product [Schistosoma mattheei]
MLFIPVYQMFFPIFPFQVGLPISPVLFYPAKAFTRTGFTALIRAHNHFTILCILLKSIQSVKSLRRIVVVWTNKIYPVPDCKF